MAEAAAPIFFCPHGQFGRCFNDHDSKVEGALPFRSKADMDLGVFEGGIRSSLVGLFGADFLKQGLDDDR